MLGHMSNGYVGKEVFKSGVPTVLGDEHEAQQFEEGVNISGKSMRIVGIFDIIGSMLLFMSVLSKKFVDFGSVILDVILGVAIYKHLTSGHGFKGAKHAMNLFGINLLNFIDKFRKKY